jgi:general secretion pathway protein A
MYTNYFGFTEKPFKPTPEPRFLYPTDGHKEALASILLSIKERNGFVALVGDVGTGKTTLLRKAIKMLGSKTKAAYIFNTELPFSQVVALILDELKLLKPGEKLAQINATRRLHNVAIRQMAQGGNLVIMVDEAQNLSQDAIEKLRLLSNLESEERKLIQVILAGQLEIEDKLTTPSGKALAQRIVFKRKLVPLKEQEIFKYLNHRMAVANYDGPVLFNKHAVRLIWQYSGGIPRKINNICDNALLTAYAVNKKRVEPHIIKEVAGELGFGTNSNGNGNHRGILSRWRRR